MKIGNVEITSNEEILILPRVGGDLVIRAKAVSLRDFEKICPEPEAPGIRTAEGFSRDEKDKGYRALMDERDSKRLAYLCIASLEPSEIEWNEVSLDKPGTWLNWSEELAAAGLSNVEINRIVNCVLSANSLDEDKIKEARDSFLLGQAQ